MSKKIVVLNGSPRKMGNTSTLIEHFTKGAESQGHEVTVFHLASMNIHGCKGCMAGGKNPDSPCVQKDDMDKIYPAYKAADVIVMASPLYYWTISGQLRVTFDRLFAVAECKVKDYNSNKECVLLMAGAANEFEDVVSYYHSLMKHLRWTSVGELLVSGVTNMGDIKGNKALEEAMKLGESI